MAKLWVKRSNSWVEITDPSKVRGKDDNTWRPAQKVWYKRNGSWQEAVEVLPQNLIKAQRKIWDLSGGQYIYQGFTKDGNGPNGLPWYFQPAYTDGTNILGSLIETNNSPETLISIHYNYSTTLANWEHSTIALFGNTTGKDFRFILDLYPTANDARVRTNRIRTQTVFSSQFEYITYNDGAGNFEPNTYYQNYQTSNDTLLRTFIEDAVSNSNYRVVVTIEEI